MASPPSDQKLVDNLLAIASGVRLQILRQLRTPKTLSEIRATTTDPDGNERPIARQTIKEHIERLVEGGFAVAQNAERDYGATIEYVIDHQRLFLLAEEFTQIARLRPATEVANATMVAADARRSFALKGPCLVLVRGIDEGRVFDLGPDGQTTKWLIGRRRGLPVCLDYDPFISSENTQIEAADESYTLAALSTSRNGTTLNFHLMPPGSRQPLRDGDIIGVGRSYLVFKG